MSRPFALPGINAHDDFIAVFEQGAGENEGDGVEPGGQEPDAWSCVRGEGLLCWRVGLVVGL